MATQPVANNENSVDKIVRKLDEFPDLLQALHDCDWLTARSFCAQLFNFDEQQSPPEFETKSALRSSMNGF